MFNRTFSASLFLLASAALAVDDYHLGPLSQVKVGVTQGKVIPSSEMVRITKSMVRLFSRRP